MNNEAKERVANTINSLDSGMPTSMSACWNYGMTWGCDIDCPVLRDGECELQDSENKELYEEMLKDTE